MTGYEIAGSDFDFFRETFLKVRSVSKSNTVEPAGRVFDLSEATFRMSKIGIRSRFFLNLSLEYIDHCPLCR